MSEIAVFRPNVDIDVLTGILEACSFAVKYHGEQTRRSGEPYVTHPLAVARNLMKLHVIPPGYVLFAAILHDVLEDTKATYSDIREQFGDTVARLVYELTNDEEQLLQYGKTIYLCRKVVHMSDNAILIKLADRYDNLSDLKPHSSGDERSAEYADGTWKMLRVIRRRFENLRSDDRDVLVQKIERLLITVGYEPPQDYPK